MTGIGYVIGELLALLALSAVVGVAIGWLGGRASAADRPVQVADHAARVEVLEEELRLAARHITDADQRAAEAERRLAMAYDTIRRDEQVRAEAARAPAGADLSFGSNGDEDRIARLERALDEKTGSITHLEQRLADQAELMERLMERIPAAD